MSLGSSVVDGWWPALGGGRRWAQRARVAVRWGCGSAGPRTGRPVDARFRTAASTADRVAAHGGLGPLAVCLGQARPLDPEHLGQSLPVDNTVAGALAPALLIAARLPVWRVRDHTGPNHVEIDVDRAARQVLAALGAAVSGASVRRLLLRLGDDRQLPRVGSRGRALVGHEGGTCKLL